MKKEIKFLGDMRARVLTILLLFLGAWSSTAWADDYVASVTINGTTTNYGTFDAAFSAATATDVSNATITLLADCSSTGFTVASGKTVSIASSGNSTYYLTMTGNVNVSGNLTLGNAVFKTTGISSSNPNYSDYNVFFAVTGTGNLTINGSYIDCSAVTADAIKIVANGAQLTVTGGVIKGGATEHKRALVVGSSNSTISSYTVKLSGGTFSGADGGIWLSSGKVNDLLKTGDTNTYGYYVLDGETWSVLSDATGHEINNTVKVATSGLKFSVKTSTGFSNYTTWSEALTAATTAGTSPDKTSTIYLLDDVSVAGFTAPADRYIAISGGNHTMTLTGQVTAQGDLYINNGKFKAASGVSDHMFVVTGTMKTFGGTFDASAVSADAVAVTISNAHLYVTDGTFIGGNNHHGLYVAKPTGGEGYAILAGGKFVGEGTGSGAILIDSSSSQNMYNLLMFGKGYYKGTETTETTDSRSVKYYTESVTVKDGTTCGTLTAHITNGIYGTICLPYDATFSGLDILNMTNVDQSAKTITVSPSGETTIMAGYPYLFKTTSDTQEFKLIAGSTKKDPMSINGLTGTYTAQNKTIGYFYLESNTTTSKFVKATSTSEIIDAYSCYITYAGISSLDYLTLNYAEGQTVLLTAKTSLQTEGYTTCTAAHGEVITLNVDKGTLSIDNPYYQYIAKVPGSSVWKVLTTNPTTNASEADTLANVGKYTFKAMITDSRGVVKAYSNEITVEAKAYQIWHRTHPTSTGTDDYTKVDVTDTKKVTLAISGYKNDEDILLYNGANQKTFAPANKKIYQDGYDITSSDLSNENTTDPMQLMCGTPGNYVVTLDFDYTGTTNKGFPTLTFNYPNDNKNLMRITVDNVTTDYPFTKATVGSNTYYVAGPFNFTTENSDGYNVDLYWHGMLYGGNVDNGLSFSPSAKSKELSYEYRKQTKIKLAPYIDSNFQYYCTFDSVNGYAEIVYPTAIHTKYYAEAEGKDVEVSFPLSYDATVGGYVSSTDLYQTRYYRNTIFMYNGVKYGIKNKTISYEASGLTLEKDKDGDHEMIIHPWITGTYTIKTTLSSQSSGATPSGFYVNLTTAKNYGRKVTKGNYGSICLPYKPSGTTEICINSTGSTQTTGTNVKVYSVASVGTNEVNLTEVAIANMVAGTPYIFKADCDSIVFNFNNATDMAEIQNTDYLVGNYAPMSDVTNIPTPVTADGKTTTCYILQSNQFKRVANSGTRSGIYRCYLRNTVTNTSGSTSGDAKASFGITVDEPTDIKEVDATNALNDLMNGNAVIYDLNGRRLPSLQKGINIVNGRKIIVR